MEIFAFVLLALALVVAFAVSIADSIAYCKRMKALKLRDQTQAIVNAKILAILEAEYPDVPAHEIEVCDSIA